MQENSFDLITLGQKAGVVKYELQALTTNQKNQALTYVADMLVTRYEEILKANAIDIATGEEKGMHKGLLDRLRLTTDRIAAMSEGLMQIVELPDPIGEVMETFDRPNGLSISKVRVPLGVVGIIYESRPNVTADAFGLCFKTGNAVILKGGTDALNSNRAITNVIRDALKDCKINPDAIQLIDSADRAVTGAFMRLNRYVDVLIPRGGAGLIRAVVENSTIPVIETGTGNCHIYVDKYADMDMALRIIENAKTQRIGVCNACESLVVHKDIAEEFLPKLEVMLRSKDVEIRADEEACNIMLDCTKATEEDFGTEYLDYIISVKIVESIKEAVEHINKYNTKHSEAIITKDVTRANIFTSRVDAACVYVNASTRFTDGFEFGFGAEIGISTQKLHARGPMGLKELTSYKYTILGDGQSRG